MIRIISCSIALAFVTACGGVPDGSPRDADPCTNVTCSSGTRCVEGLCRRVRTLGESCSSSADCSPATECVKSDWGRLCTHACGAPAECSFGTCQSIEDGSSYCLPSGIGIACDNIDPRDLGSTTWQCRQLGTYCRPNTSSSRLGQCVMGDSCDYLAQTGCPSGYGCHPVGPFGYDNNRGTLCLEAGGGTQGARCAGHFDCAPGYGCATDFGCVRYCDPQAPSGSTGCEEVRDQNGRPTVCVDIMTDSRGRPAPSEIRTFVVGICRT
jgi:hypothetical protein